MISAYLKLVAEKAGEVKGPVRDRDSMKDGSIALLAIDHGVTSLRDAATGMATGRRQHLPITVTKEIDNTSPLFNRFVATNELIKTADIFFFGFGSQSGLSSGREALQYRISLKKAFISKVELAGRLDAAAQEGNRFALTERISIVYESIHWEWLSPKMAAEDVFNSAQS